MFTIPEWILNLSGWVQRASVQAALLVLLILIVQWVLRDRLTPRWRYALWMIVLARLALPWTPSSPMSVFNLIQPSSPPPAFSLAPANMAGTTETKLTANPPLPIKETVVKASPAAPVPTPALETHPKLMDLGLQFLPLIWLAGVATISIYVLVQVLLQFRLQPQRVVTDQPTLELLEKCKEDMGVRTYLAVIQGPTVKTPALFGFLRPRLLLPEKTLTTCTPRELRHIFLHELAHLKRHDILVNWVMALLQTLHWFNPLVWYAFYRIRLERELACDRLALSRMTESPKDYGQTIVHLLEQFTQPRALPSLAGILEDKKQITRRITMIANFKKESRRLTLLAAVVMLALIGVGLTSATTAQPASTVRLVISEFTLMPYPEGGLVDLCAGVRNNGQKPVPFDVGFYINDPDRQKPRIGGGTVNPGKIFREGTRPFALKEGTNHFAALLDPKNTITGLDRSNDFAEMTVEVKNGKIVDTQAYVSSSRQTASAKDNLHLNISDLSVQPYSEGGLFTATATVWNCSKKPVSCDVGFYINDLDRKQPKIGGGTVQPGRTFREGTLPFGLKEGTNHLTAILDPNNKIPNLDRSSDLAETTVTVKNGKIVETQTTVSSNPRPLPAPEGTSSITIPDNMDLVKIRLTEGTSDGKPLLDQSFHLYRIGRDHDNRNQYITVLQNTKMKSPDGSKLLLEVGSYYISLQRSWFHGEKGFHVTGGREYVLTVVCPPEPKIKPAMKQVTLNFKPAVDVKTEKDAFRIECALIPLPDTLDLEGTQWKQYPHKGIYGLDGNPIYGISYDRTKQSPLKLNVGRYRLSSIDLLYNDTLKEPKWAQRKDAYHTASHVEFPPDRSPLLDVTASGENQWTITLQEKIVSRIQQLAAEKPRYSQTIPPKQALFDQAEALFQEGKSAPSAARNAKFSEALRLYSQIVDLYPNSKEYAEPARMMIGLCYDWMGKKEEAIKALETAVKTAPTYSQATYFYLAAFYQQAGRKTDAVKAYKQCIQLCEKQNNTGGFPCANAQKALTVLEGK
jgi:beta-lactamase regulating signal transducer with metallopeptidase domain